MPLTAAMGRAPRRRAARGRGHLISTCSGAEQPTPPKKTKAHMRAGKQGGSSVMTEACALCAWCVGALFESSPAMTTMTPPTAACAWCQPAQPGGGWRGTAARLQAWPEGRKNGHAYRNVPCAPGRGPHPVPHECAPTGRKTGGGRGLSRYSTLAAANRAVARHEVSQCHHTFIPEGILWQSPQDVRWPAQQTTHRPPFQTIAQTAPPPKSSQSTRPARDLLRAAVAVLPKPRKGSGVPLLPAMRCGRGLGSVQAWQASAHTVHGPTHSPV